MRDSQLGSPSAHRGRHGLTLCNLGLSHKSHLETRKGRLQTRAQCLHRVAEAVSLARMEQQGAPWIGCLQPGPGTFVKWVCKIKLWQVVLCAQHRHRSRFQVPPCPLHRHPRDSRFRNRSCHIRPIALAVQEPTSTSGHPSKSLPSRKQKKQILSLFMNYSFVSPFSNPYLGFVSGFLFYFPSCWWFKLCR